MAKLGQVTELKQQLKLSLNMQQSIHILQMSSLELKNFAAHELSQNPFLEDESYAEEPLEVIPNTVSLNYSPTHFASYNADQPQDYLANIATEKTLRDHLLEQIHLEIHDQKEQLIAYYLLDALQNNGYLSADTKEIAQNLKCKKSLIENVLKKLQTFDPVGIFARNLSECLKIQLMEKGILTKKFSTLIDNLELLARGELTKLTKICNVNEQKLKGMIAQIRTLNPKPANGFLIEHTSFKIPDIILTIEQDKFIKLEVNPETLPRLKLNHEYYLNIKNNIKTIKDRTFTRQEVNSAGNIIKGIQHRSKTILQIATCIAEEQKNFFTRGVMYLKPLTLNKIAQMTGFNESTVSRATSNKYISTPSGIYELKYFFSYGLEAIAGKGSDVSSTKVKAIIKQIVLSECPNTTLSDSDISQELKKFNIIIARRTVAKYREALGIPTSTFRNRQYKISEI